MHVHVPPAILDSSSPGDGERRDAPVACEHEPNAPSRGSMRGASWAAPMAAARRVSGLGDREFTAEADW